MRKKKDFDCVKFKHELFQKAYKESGAKNMYEYAEYANAQAKRIRLENERLGIEDHGYKGKKISSRRVEVTD
jgi:hypothetical protein